MIRDGNGGNGRTDRTGRSIALGLAALVVVSALSLLASAFHDLTPERFYDERHSFRNVRTLVLEGRIVPPSRLYPSLSYLPYTPPLALSEGLYRVTGVERFRVFEPDDTHDVTATGYVVARSVSVLFGLACLFLTFRLGRRLASPAAGLVAAAVLSVSWGFLLVSIKLKPDVVVMFLLLVSYAWSVRAAREPSRRSYLVAGLGIGLAAAAKYHGGMIAAVPLVAGTVVAGARRLGSWSRTAGWLALAAVTSLLTFLALNPWPSRIARNIRYQREEYARRGAAEAVSHWDMVPKALAWMLNDLGPLLFAVVALGCVALATRAWRGRAPGGAGPDRLDAAVLLATVAGYFLVFSAATTYFTFQNFVPVMPFAAVAAAWVLVTAAAAGLRRLPGGARSLGQGLLWAGLAVWVASVHLPRTYDLLIPETVTLAQERLAGLTARSGASRLVLQEPIAGEPLLTGRSDRLTLIDLERITEAPQGLLRGADAVIFPADRLGEEGGAAYRELLDGWDGEVVRFEPRSFEAQGPPLVLALRDWRSAGEPVTVTLDYHARRQRVPLDPPLARGEVVTLAIRFWSPRPWLLPEEIEVRGWGPVALHRPNSRGKSHWGSSSRLAVPRRTETLVFDLPELPPDVGPAELAIHRWRAAGAGERVEPVESAPAPTHAPSGSP